MRKHGLVAVGHDRHLNRGSIDRVQLEELVTSGESIAKIALALDRSPTTIRHWLAKYELEAVSTTRQRAARLARKSGLATAQLYCRHHGQTSFSIEGRGNYRCAACRKEAVSRRRRRVKEILVAEAGGKCALCGYNRCIAALHFHHRHRSEKSFSLSQLGVARSIERARAEATKCVLLCSTATPRSRPAGRWCR
jgi:transposase